MKREKLRTVCLLAVALFSLCWLRMSASQVFIYCPDRSQGLHIACLSADSTWQHIGQLCSSDYSTWGAEKKMYSPWVCRASDGTWRLVFQVNDYAPTLAIAYSKNLVDWRPQDYPRLSGGPCRNPVMIERDGGFEVLYSGQLGQRKFHLSFDFRKWGSDEPSDLMLKMKVDEAQIDGKEVMGQVFTLEPSELETIERFFERQRADSQRSNAFMGLPALQGKKGVKTQLKVDFDHQKAISDKLVGIFFEDISYAADGGLYAEMVQNRDFEYNEKDFKRGDNAWHSTTAWHSDDELTVSTDQPLSTANPHHIVLVSTPVWNEGWDGMSVQKGARYNFSFWVRNISVKKKKFTVSLRCGDVASEVTLTAKGKTWKRYTATLTALADCKDATLHIVPMGKGSAAVDMVSLFPEDTYKGHGLRRDLAETIAALHPKFVRFPGGCMSHGQGLDNIYHWQHTVGPWQDRVPDFNIWGYHQTRGLGFFEFFQWCEDMGAEPLPVLAAGVPCQNSAPNADGYGGQQGGIPMEDMPAYCEEICHLIEWANGNPAENEWARLRAEAGHPEPFHLKYLGIGNEDIISTTFEERCLMIARAVKERFPDIKICGTAGPFHAPSADYAEGWAFAKQHPDLFYMIDEHYYESSGWFMAHQDYYDSYERTIRFDATPNYPSPKVYLGEYSANAGKRQSNAETALAEAVYLCNLERNGDIVEMTSYAPLLCNKRHSNWNPDLIYFDNEQVYTTPSYETQRFFGQCSGDCYIPSTLLFSASEDPQEDVFPTLSQQLSERVVASVVKDSGSGVIYLKVVNTLPQPVELSLSGAGLPDRGTLAGFDAAVPADSSVRLTNAAAFNADTLILPPYSLRVITF